MGKNVTLVFPGQGSQYVGMGEKLEEKSLQSANEILGHDLSKLMTQGPEEELKLTENTQPAIITHSMDYFYKLMPLLNDLGVTVDRVLGHSVGEYAALAATECLSFSDAIKAVHFRGKYMQEAVPAGKGKMYALLKLTQEKVEAACKEASTVDEKVMPANFNEPNQIVISGDANACDRAIKWLEENKERPFRAVELKVSAPFHSSLMKPAAEKMASFLEEIEIRENKLPYVANVDAKEYLAGTSAETIKNNLVKQIDGSVQWTQSIQSLPAGSIYIEVGPGKTLSGLIRKIDRDAKVVPLDKEGAWEELKELLS